MLVVMPHIILAHKPVDADFHVILNGSRKRHLKSYIFFWKKLGTELDSVWLPTYSIGLIFTTTFSPLTLFCRKSSKPSFTRSFNDPCMLSSSFTRFGLI